MKRKKWNDHPLTSTYEMERRRGDAVQETRRTGDQDRRIVELAKRENVKPRDLLRLRQTR